MTPWTVTNKVLSAVETQEYKKQLKDLLHSGLKYSQLSRDIEHRQNTLTINQRNYQTILQQLKTDENSSLSFSQWFLDVESATFKTQLQDDLTYLRLASDLLSQATNTIRGLVQIDEAERDRQLQQTVAYLGVGVGAGGLFAASYSQKKAWLTDTFLSTESRTFIWHSHVYG